MQFRVQCSRWGWSRLAGDHHSLFSCVAFALVTHFSGPGQKAATLTNEPLPCEEVKIKRLMPALPGDRERSAPQK